MVTTKITIPKKTVAQFEINPEAILGKIERDMYLKRTGNYKILYMSRKGTPIVIKREPEISKIAEEQQ